MTTLQDKTRAFVAEHIGKGFHQRRIRKLKKAKLGRLLARRDTLLLRAQGADAPRTLVKQLLDVHAAATDSALFAEFMKAVAVFVATEANGASAARAESVDLEFARDGRHYALAIRSRPGWGSAGQAGKMMDAFRAADAAGRPSDVSFLIGCTQGEGSTTPAPQCEKLCGPDFWRWIAGEDDFDQRLVDCLDVDAAAHVKKYRRAYKGALKSLTEEFQGEFCDDEGQVNWQALAQFDPRASRPDEDAEDTEEKETEAEFK